MAIKNPDFFRQCTIRKGETQQVAWIPEGIAIVGSTVSVGNKSNQMEDGWEVLEVGETRETLERVMKMSNLHKDHRKGTDI